MTGVLIKRENLETDTCTHRICENEGRDRRDASIVKERQEFPTNQHKLLGKRHGTHSFSQSSNGTNPVNTLISDF